MAVSVVSVKIRDADGYSATTDAFVNIDPLATAGAIGTALEAWLVLLQACTAGRILDATVKLGLDTSVFGAAVMTPGIPISAATALIFPNTVNKAPWDFLVPAREPGTASNGGPNLAEDGTLDLLTDFMEVPIAGLTGSHFTTNLGAPLAGPAGARWVTRKHRRSLQAKSSRTGN